MIHGTTETQGAASPGEDAFELLQEMSDQHRRMEGVASELAAARALLSAVGGSLAQDSEWLELDEADRVLATLKGSARRLVGAGARALTDVDGDLAANSLVSVHAVLEGVGETLRGLSDAQLAYALPALLAGLNTGLGPRRTVAVLASVVDPGDGRSSQL